MIPIHRPKKTYYMPESWNEMTSRQLVDIAPVLFSDNDAESARPLLIDAILGWRIDLLRDIRKLKQKKESYELLYSDIRCKLYPLVDWIFEENDLTKNLLPVLVIPYKMKFLNAGKLYGPADNFANLTIGEFDDAEYWYDLFNISQWQDLHALDMMIAILYRTAKPKWDIAMGDIRSEYNFHLNEFRATQIAAIPIGIRLGIFLWYTGCRAALVKEYAFMFKKSDSKSSLKGWTPIIHELAGDKFGNLEETGKTLLKTILYELFILDEKATQHRIDHLELYK